MTTKSFEYTGAQQSWTVPDHVSSITVTANGAGNGYEKGGQSVLTIPVSAGDVVYPFIGGQSMTGGVGGWNGGGTAGSDTNNGWNGAGATDLRIGGTGLSYRVLVAGGAGGRGNSVSHAAGVGGGTNGGDGDDGSGGSYSGKGGTQSAGGDGATFSGEAGTLGVGGTPNSGQTYGGGAGGGGLYGGGGGSGNSTSGSNSIGSGGGGSGYLASTAPGGATSGGTTTAGGGNTGDGSMTIEYTVDSSAPSAATLVSPTASQVLDASSGVTFEVTYNATDGLDCNAYTLRLKTGSGSYSYWKASDSTWPATEVWNTLATTVADGGTITIAVPTSSSLENGNVYSWSVNTQEAGADLQGDYATDSTFTARTPPAVDITAPTDASTITDTQTPTATWTSVLASGTTQTTYRVVWESGTYGTTPGSGTSAADTDVVTSTDTSVVCPETLPLGVTYRMFVQIAETGGETSDWEYVTFTVTLSPPNAPTLTTSTGTDATTGLPQVTITATVADSDSFDDTDTTVQVQASYDDGSTWVTVRDATTGDLASTVALDSSGVASVIDAEALFGVATSYRANATGTSGDTTVVGAWSDTVTATLDCTSCWLVNPLDLTSALQVPVQTDDARTWPITQDISAWAGGTFPTIGSDVYQDDNGSYTWIPATKADRDALWTLLTSQVTLLQRLPAEQSDAGDHVYFRPLGSPTEDRLAQSLIPARLVKAAWIDRSRP